MYQEFNGKEIDLGNAPEVLLPKWNSPKETFTSYQVQIDKILKAVIDFEVNDDESSRKILNAYSDSKFLLKEVEEIKRKICAPYKHFINLVNESYKACKYQAEISQEVITKKLSSYQDKLNQLKEIGQNDNKNTFEYLSLSIEEIVQNDQKIGSTEKTIVSHKIDKTFCVIDINLVPKEYLKVDEGKINQAIKMGVSNIPGIQIIENKKMILRRR